MGAARGFVDVDVVAARKRQLERLRSLGVRFEELGPAPSTVVFSRFLSEFVDAANRPRLEERIARLGHMHVGMDFEPLLRSDAICSRVERSCMGFLTRLGRDGVIVRIERRTRMPAVRILASTLQDVWAGSWPGLFVNFDAGRALLVTLDYGEVRCDLRNASSPYR